MKRARTKQPDKTPHMSLKKIIDWCEAIDTGAAREIAQAAQRLMQTCDMPATERQKEIRKMCGAWNVDRRRGKKGERLLSTLRQELQAKLAKGASELHRASEPSTSLLVNLSATHPFFWYMESRRWGRCQHCRKRGDTFRISQNSQERLCRECSRRHAPWIDATLKESTYNLSHSDDSESSETESSEDSGQEEITDAAIQTSDLLHFISSDSDTDHWRGDR